MDVEPLRSWRAEFARSAAYRREQGRFWAAQDREREERLDNARSDQDLTDLAQTVVLATDAEIARFELKLDRYDAAVVEALDENTIMLDEVNEQLDKMLANAFVMPDGRRVFKTKDGLKVFDENGAELKADEIDPDTIEDYRTRWEDYAAKKDEQNEILEERKGLIEFQDKLDAARDKVGDEDLTKQELDELEADIDASTPIAVRRKLPGYEEQEIPDVSRDFGAVAGPEQKAGRDLNLDLPTLVR